MRLKFSPVSIPAVVASIGIAGTESNLGHGWGKKSVGRARLPR